MIVLGRKQLEALDAALSSGLIDCDTTKRLCGAPILYAEEFFDIYTMLDETGRADLFPLIDPAHYLNAYGVGGAAEQLFDFLFAGPKKRDWPHPLVRFDYALGMRPDLEVELETAIETFHLIGDGTLAISPWLSPDTHTALAQLREKRLDVLVVNSGPDRPLSQHHYVPQLTEPETDWSTLLDVAMQGTGAKTGLAKPPSLDSVCDGWSVQPVGDVKHDSPFLAQDDALVEVPIASSNHISQPQVARVPTPVNEPRLTIAVALHIFYLEIGYDILDRLERADWPLVLYVTTLDELVPEITTRLTKTGLPYSISVVENRGRDIAPFMQVLPQIIDDAHEFVLKLHTKKSPHRVDGTDWASDLFRSLTEPNELQRGMQMLCDNRQTGFVGPSGHVLPVADYIMGNRAAVSLLVDRLGLKLERCRKQGHFVAGSMFLARASALKPMLNLNLSVDQFEDETGQVDGTLAHAVERVFMLGGWCVDQMLMIKDGSTVNQMKKAVFYPD